MILTIPLLGNKVKRKYLFKINSSTSTDAYFELINCIRTEYILSLIHI